MLEENFLNFIVLFIALELYEVQWQKANTMIGMLARMYHQYEKSIFLFLFMHPTFYFAIVLMYLSSFNVYALALLLIKIIDIGMKLVLMKQVFIVKEVSEELKVALFTPINKFLPYMGVVAYPPLIYFVFH